MQTTTYENYKHRAVAGKETAWKGYWLSTERFRRLPYRPLHEYNRSPQHATETKNIHTLFRKNFSLKGCGGIRKAFLYITGDDIYKAYINGAFVGEGPAQSYPFAYNYNCFDITDLLRYDGENAIGVHVYYQGLYNISLISADNLHGMIAQIEIFYNDGSCEIVASDRSWRYKESEAYSYRHIFGYQTQFSEDIDTNKWDADWYDVSFDVSDWNEAYIPAVPYPEYYTLVPQLTPTVSHERVYPALFEKKDGYYFIDFGKEQAGCLGLKVCGKRGDVLEIRYGEELEKNGRVRFSLRANCCYQEFITLAGGEEIIDFFEYKGYRYVEIIHASVDLTKRDVWTLCRHYPFPENPADFDCSNGLLKRIWELCVHGVKLGTQDTYIDCPTREKGGFIGDALITGMTHLALTGDIRIYKKFIIDCANTARYFPGLRSHIPTNLVYILFDYSMLFPLFLQEYYRFTGDLDFVEKMLPIVDGIHDHAASFENASSLVENITQPIEEANPHSAILVDWPPVLRDDHDFEKAETGVSTVANMFYYGFLKRSSELYALIGCHEKAKGLIAKYERIAESLLAHTYNEKTGLFTDTPDSDHVGLHSNVLQIFFGLTPPQGYGPLVELIKKKRLNCGVYFAYFVIKGLYSIGEYKTAFDLLTGKDDHSWYNMLKCGATTCMEVWDPSQKVNMSWCHPWSSSPIHFFIDEIMGVKPAAPAWTRVVCAPKIPVGLDSMRISFPVNGGRITAEFVRTETGVVYTLGVPAGVEVTFDGGEQDILFQKA